MGKSFCKVEYKWCKYLKHNGICAYCDFEIKNIKLCPRIKELETIRFYDLLNSVEFETVFKILCNWYESQIENKIGYEKVFNTLKTMIPKKHKLNDFIEYMKSF